MGIDLNSQILIGYEIAEATVKQLFLVKNPGKFHMEDRFDPKTGAKLEPVKVWDEHPSSGIVYKGESYDDSEYFTELLEELVGCEVSTTGSFICGKLNYVFHPRMPSASTAGSECGRTTFGPSYWYADIVTMETSLKRIKNGLKKLGLEPGEPEVLLSVTDY